MSVYSQQTSAPKVRQYGARLVRPVFTKMFLILSAVVAMSMNIACEKKGTFRFSNPKGAPHGQPEKPAGGEPAANEVEGGISSGGGGTLPANPIGVFRVYEIVKDAKAALRMFYRLENQVTGDDPILYGLDKFVVGPRNLITLLEETEIEVLNNKPCIDKNGNEVDASIVASKPGAICLSAFRIAPKLIEERAHIEILALITHELTHLLGATEKEAVDIQKYTAIRFEKVFFENFGNQVWDMRERYSNLGALLNRAIEFAEKEDWAATNEALNKYYMDSYSLFNELWGWKYPFSIHNYDQHIYNSIQQFRLTYLNIYIKTIMPPHAGQAYDIEDYETTFGESKVLTVKEIATHSSGSWFKDCKYCGTETVTKIESKEELLNQLNQQKMYYNEENDFVWALSLGNALPTMNGPWNKTAENPWKRFIGKYSAHLMGCTDSEGTDGDHFSKDIVGLEILPGSLIESDILASVFYSNGMFTEGLSNNGVDVLGGASVKVFTEGNSVFRTAELGDKWDFYGNLGWRMKTSELSSVGENLVYTRKTEFQNYKEYLTINSWESCSFKLIKE